MGNEIPRARNAMLTTEDLMSREDIKANIHSKDQELQQSAVRRCVDDASLMTPLMATL